MKLRLQWKDPDFCDGRTGESPWRNLDEDANDELHTSLRKLGIGEYILLDVDTDTGIVEVVRPKR